MSDDKSMRGPQDAERVNVNNDYEVLYWCKKFGVTEAALRSVARTPGAMAKDVEALLKRKKR